MKRRHGYGKRDSSAFTPESRISIKSTFDPAPAGTQTKFVENAVRSHSRHDVFATATEGGIAPRPQKVELRPLTALRREKRERGDLLREAQDLRAVIAGLRDAAVAGSAPIESIRGTSDSGVTPRRVT